MALTNSLTLSHTRGSESISKTVTITGEGSLDRDVTIPTGGPGTNKEVALAFTMAGLSLIWISTDQTVLMETNDGTSPDDAYTITADKPFIWYQGCGWDLPFSADVEALFFTNAGGVAAAVKIRGIADATP